MTKTIINNVYYPDIEFDEALKSLMIQIYPLYEYALKRLNVVKENEIELQEAPVLCLTEAEIFFYKRREECRWYLMKEKEYHRNGTGIWLEVPTEADVLDYFDWLKTKNDL